MHFFNFFSLFSHFFILHFFKSVRSLHLSSGGGGEGDADGGSASHKSQVFLHCSFSASEYFFLHLPFLHVKSFASSAHAGGLGGGGDGDGGDGARTIAERRAVQVELNQTD